MTTASTGSAVTVRRYEPRDRDAVLRLAPGLTAGVAPWRPVDGVRAAATGWVRDAVAGANREDHAVFVADLRGAVVGVAGVGETTHFSGDRDAYLGELVVDPAARRSGVATALVDAVTCWAQGRGLARLTLDTGAANADARALYAALGFDLEQVRLSRALSAAPPAARASSGAAAG